MPEPTIASWRSELLESISLFLQAGLVILPSGAWLVDDIDVSTVLRSRIAGRLVQSFPSQTFNISRSIGDARGVLCSHLDLSCMLSALGIVLATPESVRQYYADQLVACLPREDVGFSELLRVRIGSRPLRTYPSLSYNRSHGLGNARGLVENSRHVKAVFAHFFSPEKS